jgi:hypothetical protein
VLSSRFRKLLQQLAQTFQRQEVPSVFVVAPAILNKVEQTI